MNTFSIKDIETLTGIKSHTIRIWEQRYNLVNPKRTNTNIRYYTDADLRTFLNINILYNAGYKISKIASLKGNQLEKEVQGMATQQLSGEMQLQALTSAMLNLNEAAFEKILLNATQQKGLEKTMEELVFPFLHHIGLLWQVGTINPAFEHFISYLVRQRIISATDGLIAEPQAKPRKFLLFLPESEPHEIGLLLANFSIRKAGHHTLYLGANLPHTDLLPIVDKYVPDYIFCAAVSGMLPMAPQDIINFLGSNFPKQHLLLTGFRFLNEPLQLPPNATLLHNGEELRNIL